MISLEIVSKSRKNTIFLCISTTMEQRMKEKSIFIHKNYPAHSPMTMFFLYSFAIKKTMVFCLDVHTDDVFHHQGIIVYYK